MGGSRPSAWNQPSSQPSMCNVEEVIFDRVSWLCLPVDFRFTPSGTEALHCREMTRRANARSRCDRARGEPRSSAHRVAGGGRPSPAPTERSMRIYRTTLFGSWFTALQEPATPHMGGAALVSVTASLL